MIKSIFIVNVADKDFVVVFQVSFTQHTECHNCTSCDSTFPKTKLILLKVMTLQWILACKLKSSTLSLTHATLN